MFARYLLAAVAVLGFTHSAEAQPKVGRNKDVIYDRRDGHALTMDVSVPKKPNGAGIILCISAEFKSTPEFLGMAHLFIVPEFLERGYVVFAVMHGSQPRYTVPEIVEDMHKAVRFIKANAKEYGVDPKRLGITGASSGGHLALMMGCDCKKGSEVAAVACFFPVTDFIEFDKPNLPPEWEQFRPLFDVLEENPKTKRLELVTPARRTELGKLCSPLYCTKNMKNAAPTFIIHGDADELVPVHQSEKFRDEMKKCGGVCKLDIKPGMKHRAADARKHLPQLIDWLDTQLIKK
jgi:acetyl esterase/lipase